MGARVASGAALLASLLVPALASATPADDSAALREVDKIITQDVANANFGDAKKKLKALLDRCKRVQCSAAPMAQIHVASGMVAAQIGQAEEAKTAFNEAFAADPNAALPASASAQAKTLFEDAHKAWLAANPQMDDAQKAGWANKQAFDLAKAAIQAEAAGNLAECIEKDKASLTLEEQYRARLHLAGCEAKSNKIIDALRDLSKGLDGARKKNDLQAAKAAEAKVAELIPKLAHVTFEAPSGVTDLKVTFDERPIPPEKLNQSFTIDPGAHVAKAEGLLRGVRVSFEQKYETKDGETFVVKITLKPTALTQGQLECMVAAKNQDEVAACLPSDKKSLVIHGDLQMSGYTDSYAVNVLSPKVNASIMSPTGGWNVGAGYVLDVLTAASPDVVATASPKFYETRHVINLTGGYKPGWIGGQIFGNYSTESDYISRTIGGSVTADLLDKQVSPNLRYSHSQDTIGRNGTDYDVFSNTFATEDIGAGVSLVLNPTSVLVLGANVQLEHGDQSKPYRYVPMFAPGQSVSIGANYKKVNDARLPIKPLEQLPLDRQRFSIGGRYIRRLGGRATLRLEERIYRDTWQITASTTDARYLYDLSERLRVGPHVHLHAQTAATFYQRIYGATLNTDGSTSLPKFRTTDRELSPMFGVTGGGSVRYGLTDPSSKVQIGLFGSADLLFNYYLNSLYTRARIATYGTLGVEVDWE